MRTMQATIAAAATAALLVAVALALGIAAARPSDYATLTLVSVAVLTTAGVGSVVGVRVRGHLVGLVLAVAALVYATGFVAEAYARFVILDGHPQLEGAEWGVLWANASWAAMFGGVIAIAFVFPDGRLPSPRWRPVAWGAVVVITGVVLCSLFTPEPFDEPFRDVDNPLPPLPDVLAPVELLLLLGLAALVVAAGIAARSRFTRAEQPERQQLLWLASSAWLIPTTLGICFLDAVAPADLDVLVFGMLLLTITAVPASIAVAMLRYRLYDLDRLVNRALVYGVLTALVFAAYYAAVVGLGRLIGDDESLAVTLATTAAVVVGVNPVRSWLQRRVDRFMYGDRADPYAGLSRLAERLEVSVTPQSALRTIVETVADSLKVPFVSIDLGRGEGTERAAVVGDPEPAEAVRVPLSFQGESVGVLVVGQRPGEALAPADHRLLGELARHAGAVVHASRLTLELQASRERLVTAQEEVRRRLRRDLHDELGPTLASAVFQVDNARDALPPDSADIQAQLGALREQLQDAVSRIRDLSYALRPPALEEGLVPAIAQQVSAMNARGARPAFTLAAPPSFPELTPAVETAAYRIVMEAVGNVARHSGARHCTIRLQLNGGLQLEVADDGANGIDTPFRPGVGITSMRERASELGATLTIEQLPTGTRVHTVLPVGVE
jgi:two-component system, NarL family, sensor kinase